MPQKKKVTRGEIGGSWRPFVIVIERNYAITKHLPKSISNCYTPVCRGTILRVAWYLLTTKTFCSVVSCTILVAWGIPTHEINVLLTSKALEIQGRTQWKIIQVFIHTKAIERGLHQDSIPSNALSLVNNSGRLTSNNEWWSGSQDFTDNIPWIWLTFLVNSLELHFAYMFA